MKTKAAFILMATFAAATWAQESRPDHVVVPFSDANRPRMVKCSLLNGSIRVTGYNGAEVIVDARSSEGRSRKREERTDGMHRIYPSGSGLNVEEADNVVTVGSGVMNSNTDITMQVPFNTSLQLHSVNGGDITVDHVTGDVEIDNTNGSVSATHISGSAVLHALNGKVLAVFDHLAGKAMSFSTLNGDIDVTLPADVHARVRMKSDNGEVFSDFDVKVDSATSGPQVEDNRSGRGRYRVKFDKAVLGSINGGGPELQFTTFNGNVYVRKTK